MALPSVGTPWTLAQKVDRLPKLEEKQSEALIKLQDQIDALAVRMTQLEAREEIMVVKAQAAANTAAVGAVAELHRQIGMLQERVSHLRSPAARRALDN